MVNIRPVKWEIEGYEEPGYPKGYHNIAPPTIESRGPEFGEDGGRERFAIVYHGSNLNRRTLQWDYESMPSHRTEQYFKTHRFYSIEEALACFEKFVRVEKKRYDKWYRTVRRVKPDPVMFL